MIENSPSKLVDSNILIYAYDKSEKEKNPIAERILESVIKNQSRIFLSTQILSEVYTNITSKIKRPLQKKEAKKLIEEFSLINNIKTLIIKNKTILKAIDLSIEYNVQYWDALIAATMQENNIQTIITENAKDFKKIPWLKVVNPFSKVNR